MAIQVQGNGGVIAEVDGTTFRAIRVTPRPIDYGSLGFYRLGMTSGTMAAAIAANSEIYQFRWADATRFAVVYRTAISAGSNVAATAAALIAFKMTVARAWTAAGSGGTRAVLTGNNQKLRSSMGSSLIVANDVGISSTGLLTAGTKTLDTQDIGNISMGIGTGAITTSMNLTFCPLVELLNIDSSSDHALVLAGTPSAEGFVLRTGVNAFPAAMTWSFSVNVSWAEVAAY
jgi:hypothetical protein